ncbi:MAG: radical SAM family heme chaperone HemW [Christensenellaceae bacterium]|jgi:oxygen-independent coproporphyrinogen-3 oxidase|nr:radical SAM family heme chaperone HemW [Christensenellaceae bacterium]
MMLYLHLPFCKRKCPYCDFVSFPGREGEIGRYVGALLREMEQKSDEFGPKEIGSVFFGGGTPSLLPIAELERLFKGLRRHFRIQEGAEITLEANPGTLSPQWLRAAASLGANRLSLGAQAAQDRLLRAIGRIHQGNDIVSAVNWAKEAGFLNISADLMYALPGQSLGDFEESLRLLLRLGLPHISCYNLTIEEATPFGQSLKRGELALPSEDEELAFFDLAGEILAEGGLRRYEISNYALPGFESRHNLGYWNRGEYLGLGCAAHSLAGDARFANAQSLDGYFAALKGGKSPETERQILSEEEICFEEIMLGLRKMDGVVLSEKAFARYEEGLKALELAGFAALDGRRARLTAKGLPVMNAILTRLMG